MHQRGKTGRSWQIQQEEYSFASLSLRFLFLIFQSTEGCAQEALPHIRVSVFRICLSCFVLHAFIYILLRSFSDVCLSELWKQVNLGSSWLFATLWSKQRVWNESPLCLSARVSSASPIIRVKAGALRRLSKKTPPARLRHLVECLSLSRPVSFCLVLVYVSHQQVTAVRESSCFPPASGTQRRHQN